jgi:tetratricopeptide (TPR) repeat protein
MDELDYKRASEIYNEILSERFVQEAYEGLSKIYYQERIYDDLYLITENALDNSKPNEYRIQLLSLLGEIDYKQKRIDKADSLWDSALEMYPLSMNTYSIVADAQTRSSAFGKAIETLRLGNKKLEGNLYSDKILKLLVSAQDYKSALPLILEDLEKSKNLNTAIGRLYPFMSLGPEAQTFIGDAIESKHDSRDNILYTDLYLWFLKTDQQFDKAIEVVEKIDDLKKSDGRQLYNFANEMIQEGNNEIASKTFQILLDKGEKHRFYNSALYGFATAAQNQLESSKNIDIESLEKILDIYDDILDENKKDNITAVSLYRSALIYHKYLDNDRKAIDNILLLKENFPALQESYEAQLLLSDIYVSNKEFDKAEALLLELPQIFKRTVSSSDLGEVIYKLAVLNLYKGDIEQAGNLLTKAISNSRFDVANNALEINQLLSSTKDTMALKELGLALHNEKIEDYDKAIEILEPLTVSSNAFGDFVALKIAQINYTIGNYKQAIEYAENIKKKDVLSPAAEKALLLKAKAYQRSGDIDNSVDTYRRFMMDYPNSIHIEDVRSAFRELRKKDETGLPG